MIKTLGSEVGSRRGSTGVFSRRDGDGKPEYSWVGETMLAGSSDVFSCGSGEGYPLVDSLCS